MTDLSKHGFQCHQSDFVSSGLKATKFLVILRDQRVPFQTMACTVLGGAGGGTGRMKELNIQDWRLWLQGIALIIDFVTCTPAMGEKKRTLYKSYIHQHLVINTKKLCRCTIIAYKPMKWKNEICSLPSSPPPPPIPCTNLFEHICQGHNGEVIL